MCNNYSQFDIDSQLNSYLSLFKSCSRKAKKDTMQLQCTDYVAKFRGVRPMELEYPVANFKKKNISSKTCFPELPLRAA